MEKKLHIEGMSCMHCVNRVKASLEELGTKVIEVNLKGKYALIECENISDEKIKEAIYDAGYDVVEIN